QRGQGWRPPPLRIGRRRRSRPAPRGPGPDARRGRRLARERRLTTRKPAGASLDAWLDQHTARAPGVLRRRVVEYAGAAPPATTIADTLAHAAEDALRQVLAAAEDRS